MSHPSSEQLAAYWLGDVPETEAAQLEEHVFACAACAQASARMAALPSALTAAFRGVVSTAEAEQLLARDPRARRVLLAPGGRAVVDFSQGAKAQLVALQANLEGATQVDVTLCTRDGDALAQDKDVPFDAEAGTVTIACRIHYLRSGQFPLEITLRVEALRDGLRSTLGSFDIDHIPPV